MQTQSARAPTSTPESWHSFNTSHHHLCHPTPESLASQLWWWQQLWCHCRDSHAKGSKAAPMPEVKTRHPQDCWHGCSYPSKAATCVPTAKTLLFYTKPQLKVPFGWHCYICTGVPFHQARTGSDISTNPSIDNSAGRACNSVHINSCKGDASCSSSIWGLTFGYCHGLGLSSPSVSSCRSISVDFSQAWLNFVFIF